MNPAEGVSRQRQIFDQIRDMILAGRLSAGTRLPSTRTLAAKLSAARNTVLFAYEQLEAEGYLEARPGSGHYVSAQLPENLLNVAPVSAAAKRHAADITVSRRGELVWKAWSPSIQRGKYVPFAPEPIAADEFPVELWARLCARHFRHARRRDFGYGELAGLRPLREQVASYLLASRGIRCDPDQVVILSGSQQAVDLACRVLLDAGDRAAVEDPCYRGTRVAILAAGATLVPTQVDEEGLQVERLISRRPPPRLVYVTPSHQYPLGAVLSLRRRLALLDWAQHTKAWILEDDYDGEFRYRGRPLLALQALDRAGRVIYLGTFSRVLLPSLRLGYLVLPHALVNSFLAMRAVSDDSPPLLTQAATAEFLGQGHFARHVRRMRAMYAERRAVLLDAAHTHLRELLHLQPDEAGLQMVGWLKDGISEGDAQAHAQRRGLDVRPLAPCCVRPLGRPGLVLGFAGFPSSRIRTAAAELSRALREARNAGKGAEMATTRQRPALQAPR